MTVHTERVHRHDDDDAYYVDKGEGCVPFVDASEVHSDDAMLSAQVERVGVKGWPYNPTNPKEGTVATTFSARPIRRVIIDDLTIDGDRFQMGSLQHNINDGTVSLTFANVKTVDVIYMDQS